MFLGWLYFIRVLSHLKSLAISFLGACFFCRLLMWTLGVSGGTMALLKICFLFSLPTAILASDLWIHFHQSQP